ncbi:MULTISPECIES: hypothetical protein [unclassified Ruegeria]|uniref:hypothetical protein n=1 Tax=unclassified Ruegeria TaxID=2625375 RepID=UPI001488EAFB|nr:MULTISPECIES: hypothetical protein [unclassified Ruegeria]
MTHVAEIVTFTLANGTTPEEFVKLSQSTEAFVRAAPGFTHRQLSQGEDGRWTDYVIWADMKAAKDAAAQFPQQDFAPALMAAIDPETMQMRHENVLWNMTA